MWDWCSPQGVTEQAGLSFPLSCQAGSEQTAKQLCIVHTDVNRYNNLLQFYHNKSTVNASVHRWCFSIHTHNQVHQLPQFSKVFIMKRLKNGHLLQHPKSNFPFGPVIEFFSLQQLETKWAASPSLLWEARPKENAASNVSVLPWINGCAQQLATAPPLFL